MPENQLLFELWLQAKKSMIISEKMIIRQKSIFCRKETANNTIWNEQKKLLTFGAAHGIVIKLQSKC